MAEKVQPGYPPPEYLLHLRALRSDVPPPVRLRRLVKALRRGYEFRCLDYRELPPAAASVVPSP